MTKPPPFISQQFQQHKQSHVPSFNSETLLTKEVMKVFQPLFTALAHDVINIYGNLEEMKHKCNSINEKCDKLLNNNITLVNQKSFNGSDRISKSAQIDKSIPNMQCESQDVITHYSELPPNNSVPWCPRPSTRDSNHYTLGVPEYPNTWRGGDRQDPQIYTLDSARPATPVDGPTHQDDGWRVVRHGGRPRETNKVIDISTSNKFTVLENPPTSRELNKNIKHFKINYITGDIFEVAKHTPVVHCVGRDLIMKKGFALKVRERFGQIDKLISMKKQVGEVAVLPVYENGYVFNLITKESSYNLPLISNIKKCLIDLKQVCHILGVNEIAMPRIATGRDQVHWYTVSNMLREVFGASNMTINVYSLPHVEEVTPAILSSNPCLNMTNFPPLPSAKKLNQNDRINKSVVSKDKSPQQKQSSVMSPATSPPRSFTPRLQEEVRVAEEAGREPSVTPPPQQQRTLEQRSRANNTTGTRRRMFSQRRVVYPPTPSAQSSNTKLLEQHPSPHTSEKLSASEESLGSKSPISDLNDYTLSSSESNLDDNSPSKFKTPEKVLSPFSALMKKKGQT